MDSLMQISVHLCASFITEGNAHQFWRRGCASEFWIQLTWGTQNKLSGVRYRHMFQQTIHLSQLLHNNSYQKEDSVETFVTLFVVLAIDWRRTSNIYLTRRMSPFLMAQGSCFWSVLVRAPTVIATLYKLLRTIVTWTSGDNCLQLFRELADFISSFNRISARSSYNVMLLLSLLSKSCYWMKDDYFNSYYVARFKALLSRHILWQPQGDAGMGAFLKYP